MRPMDKATADNRSVLSFAIIKTQDTGILLLALFKLELEMHYPSEIACVQSPPPPFSDFFWGEGEAVVLGSSLKPIIHL